MNLDKLITILIVLNKRKYRNNDFRYVELISEQMFTSTSKGSPMRELITSPTTLWISADHIQIVE